MQHNGLDLPVVAAIVFAGSYAGTALVRTVAKGFGYVALPRADRWHQKPTALLGGMGFCPPFLVGAASVLKNTMTPALLLRENINVLKLPLALLAGSFLMAAFGLFDDLKEAGPKSKFLAQVIAASLF